MLPCPPTYGLGEAVVQGAVDPDEIYVFKPTLALGKRPILRKRVGSKEFKIIYDAGAGKRTRTVPVADVDREKLCISDDDILQLARWACRIEKHYSDKRGGPTPMDIEWAKDGRTGDLFIVQARPETVHSQRLLPNTMKLDVFELGEGARADAKVLIQGRSVGDRIGAGPARVIDDPRDLARLEEGEVLVAKKTDPDWEPAMKRAAAIVTDHGGRTCHAAIVSRELGIPAVIGSENATTTLKTDQLVTVSCAEGDTGYVFEGRLPFKRRKVDAAALKPTITNIMLNVANPDEALRLGLLPSDGVGLARMEFIISHAIKVHPMALVKFDELPEGNEKREIARLTRGHATKTGYFVDKLAEGIAMITAAFYPREVIIRFSDFKTNEYAGLLGGKGFEPAEENPMLGFRGASRYYHERYRQGFALECAAIRRVRDEMGLTNLKAMIPFCRTINKGNAAAPFLVGVTCAQAAATCFCSSMGTGPALGPGYDLALAEFVSENDHYFTIEVRSERGALIASQIPRDLATSVECDAVRQQSENTARTMTRQLKLNNPAQFFKDRLEHTRWDEVASRCLSCANCTLVCPTCFCTTVEDTSDLSGDVAERWLRWDSCFHLDFSYLHGGSVRQTTKSRYRQWLTHKLGAWH